MKKRLNQTILRILQNIIATFDKNLTIYFV